MRLRGAGVVAGLTMLLAVAPASGEVVGEKGGLIYVKQKEVLPQGPNPQAVEADAQCPSGAVPTGGGGKVTGVPGGTAIAGSGPSGADVWDVTGWHTGINSEDEALTSWLVCTEKFAGKVSRSAEFLEVDKAPAGGDEFAVCNFGHATGGGVRQTATADWWLNSTGPVDVDADTSPDDGWLSAVQHLSGPPTDLVVQVICMEGKEPVYRAKDKESSDIEKVTQKAFCPKGTSTTGGGASASGGTADSHITSTAPIDSKKDADKVPDDGWKAKFFNGTGADQVFTASVVCR